MQQRLILASGSPQRNELLAGLGLSFDVIPSTVNESNEAETDPATRARVLAKAKAKDIARVQPDAFVIGCDTLVVTEDGILLEKPLTEADARRMIALQSGATSTVHSAVCVIDPSGVSHEELQSSCVTFAPLTTDDVDWWISTGCWKNRSGAFQIDGKGQLLISHIDGDWTSVVGLPMFTLGTLLRQAGFTGIHNAS